MENNINLEVARKSLQQINKLIDEKKYNDVKDIYGKLLKPFLEKIKGVDNPDPVILEKINILSTKYKILTDVCAKINSNCEDVLVDGKIPDLEDFEDSIKDFSETTDISNHTNVKEKVYDKDDKFEINKGIYSKFKTFDYMDFKTDMDNKDISDLFKVFIITEKANLLSTGVSNYYNSLNIGSLVSFLKKYINSNDDNSLNSFINSGEYKDVLSKINKIDSDIPEINVFDYENLYKEFKEKIALTVTSRIGDIKIHVMVNNIVTGRGNDVIYNDIREVFGLVA